MRRTWMLLLVTVLLAVFLAVPAMAAEHDDCGNHCCDCVTGTTDAEKHPASEGWLSLNEVLADATVSGNSITVSDTANSDLLVNNGKYYLDGPLTASLTIIKGLKITICLNGQEWTRKGTNRCLLLSESGDGYNINIVDCSEQDENGVSQGVIRGGEYSGHGGTMYLGSKNTTADKNFVNFYNGTITGGVATSSKNGGNIYMSRCTLNIYGGVITGGQAGYGGNVYSGYSVARVNLIRGTIQDGVATKNGGNVYLGYGNFSIGQKDVTATDELNVSAVITNGWAKSKHGGNIYIAEQTTKPTLNMYYGTISNGKGGKDASGKGHGGNVRIVGTMNMYGGLIYGGCTGVTEDDPVGTSSSHANVHMLDTGNLTISGGWIKGYIDSYKNTSATTYPSLTVSGSAKIYDEDNDNDGLCDGGVALLSGLKIAGKLNNDAKIAVLMNSGNTTDTTIKLIYAETSYADIAEDWAGYIQNRQLVGYGDKWLTWQAVEGVGTAKYETDTTNNVIWHCVCGANPFEAHIGECDGYDIDWTGITNNTKLSGTGDYYLNLSEVETTLSDKDDKPVYSFNWATLSGTDANAVKQVRLDLNGHTLETATAGGRFISFYQDTRTTPYDVVITDSSAGHTGRIGVYGTFAKERTLENVGNVQGRIFWMPKSLTRSDEQSFGDQLSVYRITLDASSCQAGMSTTSGETTTKEAWRGTVANVGYNSRANFYNCDMVGGSTSNTNVKNGQPYSGMVIRMEHKDCSVNIVGGTIQSGDAVIGGGVGLTGGTLTIDGTTIYGGNATESGGAIHALGGTIDIRNTTIIGGQAETAGGAIYVDGSVNLDITNSRITNKTGKTLEDGTEEKVTLSAGTGGAICQNGDGTITISGCTIEGGIANLGGGIYMGSGNVTLDKLTRDEVTTNMLVTGGSAQLGGNVYVAGGTLIVRNATVSNGVAIRDYGNHLNGSGSNVYVAAGSVDIEDSRVEQGTIEYINTEGLTYSYDSTDSITVEGKKVYVYHGGTALYAEGGTINITRSTLEGYRDAKLLKRAGTIYNKGAEINLTDAIVTATWVNTSASCVFADGGKITINGKTVIDASVLGDIVTDKETGKKLASITFAGAVLTNSENAIIVMNDGEIIGFRSAYTNGGGSVSNNGKFYMNGGTIRGGEAIYAGNTKGGNVVTGSTKGLFHMTGGTITGGKVGGKGSVGGSNVAVTNGQFIMTGGKITSGTVADSAVGGGVYVYAAATVKIGGTAKIEGNAGGNLYLVEGKTLELGYTETVDEQTVTHDLTAEASVGITCADGAGAEGKRAISSAMTADSAPTGLFSDDAKYKISWIEEETTNTVYLVTPEQAIGAIVNDGSLVVTLPKAIEMATGTNDFVKLVSDYNGEQLVVSKDLNLDLNGKMIEKGLKLTGGKLKLVDSANANFEDNSITINEDKSVTNKNRLPIETIGGTIERAFVTGSFENYGHNYRFLVLKHKDADGNYTYSSHRIYLAVKNPVLYPTKAAMSFKTVLGCDATVAGYVKEYGVIATGNSGSDSANYLDKDGVKVLAYGGVNQNAMTAAVVNILDEPTEDENALEAWIKANEGYATSDLSGQAYILVNDAFYGDGKNEPITSAKKSANLKQLVQDADKMTLTNPQKVAAGKMYNKYKVLFEEKKWGLENLPKYVTDATTGIKTHCLCGDTSSKNNACAAAGHPQLDWQPLPADYLGGTLETGNYYLTKEITLANQMEISAGEMVCLDLNGYNITSVTKATTEGGEDSHTRMALVYGTFNITNSNKATESTISMSCYDAGNGGILIGANDGSKGNVSLYKGVTLQAEEVHKIKRGLVEVGNGSLNIYGANLKGATLLKKTESDETKGGAISTTNNGSYVFINEGTIEGGNATKGGAIYMNGGTVEVCGNAQIKGGMATYGANVYVNAGTFTLNGGTVSNQELQEETETDYLYGEYHALHGGNIYLNDGKFEMKSGTVTGGIARNGGNLYVQTSAEAVLSGGTIQNGRVVANGWNETDKIPNKNGHGGNVYNRGTAELSGVQILDGRATHMSGNVYSSGHLTISGGMISGGKENYDKTGQWISNTATNLMIVDGNLTMTGGTVDGGITINNNSRDWETHGATCYLKVSGSAKLLGTNNGISLSHGEITEIDPETDKEVGTGKYYKSPVFDANALEKLDEEAVIVIRSAADELFVKRPKKEDGTFAMDDAQWQAVIEKAKAVFDYSDAKKMITYEEDGIYLRNKPAEGTRYGCACGANEDEAHTAECKGYDVLWTKWDKLDSKYSTPYIPDEPGYWYLDYSSKVVSGTNNVVNVVAATFMYDYLADTEGDVLYTDGKPTKVYSVVEVDDAGNVAVDENGQYKANGQVVEEDHTYLGTTAKNPIVKSYDIHVDLNGFCLDGPQSSRIVTYYGRNTKTYTATAADPYTGEITESYIKVGETENKEIVTYHRQAAVNLTIIDSSKDHVGGLGTSGAYDKSAKFALNSQVQGSIIWMPHKFDSLKIVCVTMDASNATHGRGHALETNGTVHLWNTEIIGGTATSYVRTDDELKADYKGGGAVTVNSNGNVTMHGGKIYGGTAIYEWVRGDYAEMKTNAYGGGNVFVDGGVFTMDGGEITGGETWIVDDSAVNDLIEYTPGVGGGVYMHGGEFHVKGDAKVHKNYYNTYTVNNNGTPDNYYDDTYVCTKDVLTDDTYDCEKIDDNKKSSNVYLGAGAIYNDGLTEGANIGIHKDVYQGVIAHTASDCRGFLHLENTDVQIENAIFDAENDILTFTEGVYKVGYGMASTQPTRKDLNTGLSLNGYGNTDSRTTNNLYTNDATEIPGKTSYSDLAATAVAITDAQGDTVVLISVDLMSVSSSVASTARNMIAMKTGVPKENIVISASHQHSCPSVSTVYYKNNQGKYTDANGTEIGAPQDRVVKTDYARTFYHGVVNAAVAAMTDRKEATVTAGILDTTSGGDQYNFVRNKTITVVQDYPHTYSEGTIQYGKGQTYNVTDNHYGVEYSLYNAIIAAYKVKENGGTPNADQQKLIDSFSIQYESNIDTTMQLVKFSQTGGKEIVLANFQTHPHKGGDANSYLVHSDVVGAFRYYLNQELGANVIYFSGAGGNVNTSGALDYEGKSTDAFGDDNDVDRMQNVDTYGRKLASLANAFIRTENNMKPVAAARDVAVTTRTVEYTIQAPNITDGAIERINEEFMHWNGGELDGKYHDEYDPTTFQSELWWKMVGQFTHEQANEKIYSAYHASRAYTRYKAYNITGDTTGEISISAYNIGGIGFVAAPYEMFQESGQAIKKGVENNDEIDYTPKNGSSPFTYTIIATQANGGHGYIATDVAYDNGGGYSSTDNSLFAAGTAEILVGQYVEMLNALNK